MKIVYMLRRTPRNTTWIISVQGFSRNMSSNRSHTWSTYYFNTCFDWRLSTCWINFTKNFSLLGNLSNSSWHNLKSFAYTLKKIYWYYLPLRIHVHIFTTKFSSTCFCKLVLLLIKILLRSYEGEIHYHHLEALLGS